MAARSAIEWIGMSKAQLVLDMKYTPKMCDVLSFAQQVTNVLGLSPYVVICRNVLYFPYKVVSMNCLHSL